MDGVEDDVELVILVRLQYSSDQLIELDHGPLIQIRHLGKGDDIFIDIKIVKITQQIAHGIAQLTVGLAGLLEDVHGIGDIGTVVGRADPQAQYVCAVLLDDVQRADGVAQGFRLLSPLLVYEEAMSQYCPIRSAAADGNSLAKGRIEPTAMLIRSFKIEISRPAELRPALLILQNREMRRTGIEPHVHGIGFLAEMAATALGTFITFGKQLLGFIFEPALRAFFTVDFLQMGNGFVVDDIIAAIFTMENRDGDAPGPLTGNAPVAAILDHIEDALSTPAGDPLYAVDSFQRFLAETVDGSEPLLRSPEQDGSMATPAGRILMPEHSEMHQGTAFI